MAERPKRLSYLYFAQARDSVTIEFDGQCGYSFPAQATAGHIDICWAIVEDCTHDIGLKHSYGLEKVPLPGKPFLQLRLANDSILTATYLYPSWRQKVNERYDASKTFPDTFFVARR